MFRKTATADTSLIIGESKDSAMQSKMFHKEVDECARKRRQRHITREAPSERRSIVMKYREIVMTESSISLPSVIDIARGFLSSTREGLQGLTLLKAPSAKICKLHCRIGPGDPGRNCRRERRSLTTVVKRAVTRCARCQLHATTDTSR